MNSRGGRGGAAPFTADTDMLPDRTIRESSITIFRGHRGSTLPPHTTHDRHSAIVYTTSVQAKIDNGVHFSVWSLRPATTSVP